MIKTFTIHHFRKFEKIKFENLGPINIFLGNNNVGKTTVLEAIYGFTCGQNIAPLLSRIMRMNEKSAGIHQFSERLMNVFYDQDKLPLYFEFEADFANGNRDFFAHLLTPAEIFADLNPRLMNSFGSSHFAKIQEIDNGIGMPRIPIGSYSIVAKDHGPLDMNISYPLPELPYVASAYHGRFTDILEHRNQRENAQLFYFLQRENILEEFVEEMTKTFTDITDIATFPTPDGKQVQINCKTRTKGWLPLYSFGDGMQRWYNILAGLIIYRNAIHCLEEVDATLHPDAQKQLAKNLVHYAEKYNNQLFMTSHSLEFVDNLLDSIYDADEPPTVDPVRIITLRHDEQKGIVKTRVLTGQEAYKSREKFRLELR